MHEGVCGGHQFGPKTTHKLRNMGYYRSTIIPDCVNWVRRCHQCQVHENFIHQHPQPLHPTVLSWLFATWGTDVIGPIEPPSSKGHRFILVTTNYFSRWVKLLLRPRLRLNISLASSSDKYISIRYPELGHV